LLDSTTTTTTATTTTQRETMADTALHGVDISKIMSEEGTLVKCVLLRCQAAVEGDDHKQPAASSDAEDAIGRSIKDVTEMSIKEIKRELQSYGVMESFVEKEEMVQALQRERQTRLGTTRTDAATTTTTSSSTPSPTKTNHSSTIEAATVTQEDIPRPQLFSHLIEEITIDTTPRKSQVAKLLGGNFTFLGQYEDEGIMVMVRRPDWEMHPNDYQGELPVVNPHRLQPPLNDVEVRGDILLMRVAETKEDLDEDQDGEVENQEECDQGAKQLHVPSSEEFFLDYTKEEYLKFAARTDIVWKAPIEEDDDESEEEVPMDGFGAAEEDDDEHDENYDPEAEVSSDEEFDSEEHQIGMMNLILGQILRKFHEENGRGPNTLELLDMRKALADKLGVDVPEVDEEACDWNKKIPTPKKHDRKVVVDEEKNECETIECEEDEAEETENQNEKVQDVDDNDADEQHGATAPDDGDDSTELKRPVAAMNGVSENKEHESKRAKLEDDDRNEESQH